MSDQPIEITLATSFARELQAALPELIEAAETSTSVFTARLSFRRQPDGELAVKLRSSVNAAKRMPTAAHRFEAVDGE